MPKSISVQNNFIHGLVTEATGLTFPENACTDTSNCVFSLIGDVTRRLGINYEANFNNVPAGLSGQSVSTFRWINAGGDGETEILVVQEGAFLVFFTSSLSTVSNPLSHHLQAAVIDMSGFQATGNTNSIAATEAQFATGNGYLFVFHPDCDPFYCTYSEGAVTGNVINVQTRDFLGFYPEPGNPGINFRPSSLTAEHQYNLQNQGWTGTPPWTAVSNSANLEITPAGQPQNNIQVNTGSQTFTVASGISGVVPGSTVTVGWSVVAGRVNIITGADSFLVAGSSAIATVVSYTGTSLVLDIIQNNPENSGPGFSWIALQVPTFSISPGVSNNTLASFKTASGLYPSNSDIWYTFKDSTGTFNPTDTFGNVGITSTPAPRGYYIYNTFNQTKSETSGIVGLTDLSTSARPSTGTWFQGRVWYAGVNGSSPPAGDQNFYTWSESIYFSQIITPGDVTSFGYCYQQNDPTDESLFALLPTDGGVITIQGCGNIFKLFPIQNGMLVFADNGVWFITGSQGIGFSATDYTITKISSVKSISSTSYVDVMGLPYFWNAEGIYRVMPAQGQGIGLAVEPLTIGTILSFYNEIPLDSKVYARGDYDPINYIIKWVYRSTQEDGLSNRYVYDSVLNLNIYNKAFYPYSIVTGSGSGAPFVGGLFYMNYPNSLTAPEPGFKYLAYLSTYTFAEENDETYIDWASVAPQDYTSFFTTGYNLHGKGIQKWQPTYVTMYLRNDTPYAYTIQGKWDYSISGNSGRWSSKQTVIGGLGQDNFNMVYRRHKIRGHGEALQLSVSSVSGQPFDIMGWTIIEQIDAGV